MHYWGDEWFEANGNDLYHAISFIEKRLRKFGIGVCGKEKYGTYRDEYLQFWNGGLYQILFGYRAFIGPFGLNKYPRFKQFMQVLHTFIYNKVDYATPKIPKDTPWEDYHTYFEKRIWLGLIHINKKIGLTKLVNKFQAYQFNKTFQLACKKWPNIIDELISDIDGYEMIKPCKWGDVDGTEIHNKYWTTI